MHLSASRPSSGRFTASVRIIFLSQVNRKLAALLRKRGNQRGARLARAASREALGYAEGDHGVPHRRSDYTSLQHVATGWVDGLLRAMGRGLLFLGAHNRRDT